MNREEIRKNIENSLVRTVLIADPEYIIGEDKTFELYRKWVDQVDNVMLGAVILGQIGNGKTHFLRYARKKMEEEGSAIGIYMPDMFINGPLAEALNGLYSLIFRSTINRELKSFLEEWNAVDLNSNPNKQKYENNNIIRYLLRCNNDDEKILVLEYFSNKEMFPDQLSYLRKKFSAKKRFINNENDFVKAFGDALEFIQLVTTKKILLFIDEVDKVYSDSTNSVSLTKVGYKILTTYRTLFDYMNSNGIKGIIAVGATIEAWEVLSYQTAFERRFKDHMIVLKTPKEKGDVVQFLVKRFTENGVNVRKEDKRDIEEYIEYLNENDLKSWADVISALMRGNKGGGTQDIVEPKEIILDVLREAIRPLTWDEMIQASEQLAQIYPKGQPTKLLQQMNKDELIFINEKQPYTYEINE